MRFTAEDRFTVEIYTTDKPRGNSPSEKLIFTKSDLDLNQEVFEEKVNITLPKESVISEDNYPLKSNFDAVVD